jgi:hypothetical protein
MRNRRARRARSCWRATLAAVFVFLAAGPVPGRAPAQDNRIAGRIEYTGGLGPVGSRRPLCLCVYTDAEMRVDIGCLIFRSNPVTYQITGLAARDFYVVAFVDLEINERLDPEEPFEIYRDRVTTPADPVAAAPGTTGIDFVFGDENLALATPTPTVVPASTSTPLPNPTMTLGVCPGDCDDDGSVPVSEIVLAVSIALGLQDLADCLAADLDGNGRISVSEIVTAVNAALGGCLP